MKLIRDYAEISPLVREYFKVGMLTNNFLKEDEYKLLINEKALFYYKWSGGLLFFKKRKDDFLCFYQIINIDSKVNLEEFENLVLPVVVEIVLRPNDKDTTRVEKFFEKLNFNICLKRLRMKKILEQSLEEHTLRNNKIMYSDDSKIKEVRELLNECFNKHTGCIPSDKELELDIEKGRVLIALDNSNHVIGVLHFFCNKSKIEIKHLAVKEKYRNKGIASELIRVYHEENNCSNAFLWVSEDNYVAINFYRKKGYDFDGYRSVVFINEKG